MSIVERVREVTRHLGAITRRVAKEPVVKSGEEDSLRDSKDAEFRRQVVGRLIKDTPVKEIEHVLGE